MPQITLKLLFYISYILHPNYPIYFFPAYMYFVYEQIKKLNSFLDVIPCPYELIHHYVKNKSNNCLDVNNCVIISEDVEKKLKTNSFNHAFINVRGNKDDFRIIQTVSISNIGKNDLLLSENLYHNINKQRNINKMRLASIQLKHIKIAKEVEVSLINTQHDINNEIIDILLKNYFKIPRIMYKHDVFSVNVNLYAPELVCSSFQLLDVQNIYFKCKKVSSEQTNDSVSGLFCVNGETTLIQSANIRCYLPLSIFKLCDSDNLAPDVKYEDCLISKCPYGLESHLKDIEKAVLTFIPKSKFKIMHKSNKTIIINYLLIQITLHQ